MRLIDADAIIKELNSAKTRFDVGENAEKTIEVGGSEFIDAVNKFFIKVLEKAQTIDAQPVARGKWVKNKEESEKLVEPVYDCSACNNYEAWGEYERHSYCPNCGAKMDLEG